MVDGGNGSTARTVICVIFPNQCLVSIIALLGNLLNSLWGLALFRQPMNPQALTGVAPDMLVIISAPPPLSVNWLAYRRHYRDITESNRLSRDINRL